MNIRKTRGLLPSRLEGVRRQFERWSGTQKNHIAPVQELLRVLHGFGVDCVIPLGTDGVAGELDGLELGIADTPTS